MSKKAEEQPNGRVVETREYLRYDFTNEELLEKSKLLARSLQELGAVESELKRIVADVKSQIQAKENVVAEYSRLVNNGYEYRTIDCEMRFHEPKQGDKTLVRLDSGEVVKVSPMTGAEMQEVLFPEAGK